MTLSEEAVEISVSPEEDFERVLLEKISPQRMREESLFRLTVIGGGSLVVGLTEFFDTTLQQEGFRLSSTVSVGEHTRLIPIAKIFVSENGTSVENFLGKGATTQNLFDDLELFSLRDNGAATGRKTFPLEIGGILGRFMANPERKTLEEIYRHCDTEKIALWTRTAMLGVPVPGAAMATVVPEKFVVDFVKRHGRPPYFNNSRDDEIRTGEPLTVDIFDRRISLFEKYTLSDGGTFFLADVVSKNDQKENESFAFRFTRAGDLSVVNLTVFNLSIDSKENQWTGFSMRELCRKLPVEGFSKRLLLCSKTRNDIELLLGAESMITKKLGGLLPEKELTILASMLSGTVQYKLYNKKVILPDGTVHELVVAGLSKLSTDKNGSVLRSRRNLVLSDNGQLLTGRYILGGDEALKVSAVEKSLFKIENHKQKER